MPKKHKQPSVPAFEQLVEQFSDPLSFYRELVQNSLDAGSREIDIDLEFLPGKRGATVVMIIHVDDYGEGMNRRIIDTRLTCLFSSGKDGDLTKIGRFGIGFVSVFAIKPDAVNIDTSRDGENWRILFDRDMSYVRIVRDEPVEGTKIQIIKQVGAREFKDFVSRSQKVIRFWCRHASAEIRFNGKPINVPFDLDSPIRIKQQGEGMRVVVAFARDQVPFCGYYNQGLTLLEGEDRDCPYASFKIDSRFLEHTLTRDNVMRDSNFNKAMAVVDRLRYEELPRLLFNRLETALTHGTKDSELGFMYKAGARYFSPHGYAHKQCKRIGIANHKVMMAPSGELLSLECVGKALLNNELLYASEANPLTAALEDRGEVIVRVVRKSPAFSFLRALGRGAGPKSVTARFCLPLPLSEAEMSSWILLQEAVTGLFRDYGAKLKRVAFGHFKYKGSGISSRVAIMQKREGVPIPRNEILEFGTSFFSRRRILVVNADHDMVRECGMLADKEPEMAAFFLVKLFFLRGDLTLRMNTRLCWIALEQRCRRLQNS